MATRQPFHTLCSCRDKNLALLHFLVTQDGACHGRDVLQVKQGSRAFLLKPHPSTELTRCVCCEASASKRANVKDKPPSQAEVQGGQHSDYNVIKFASEQYQG